MREEGCREIRTERSDAYAVRNPFSCTRTSVRGFESRGCMWPWIERNPRNVHPLQLQARRRSQGWAAGLLRLGASPGLERDFDDCGHNLRSNHRAFVGFAVG